MYFEVIFCEKIAVGMKNVKFRGIPRKNEFRGTPRDFRGSKPRKTQMPRLGSKFRGPRKTVGPSDYGLAMMTMMTN